MRALPAACLATILSALVAACGGTGPSQGPTATIPGTAQPPTGAPPTRTAAPSTDPPSSGSPTALPQSESGTWSELAVSGPAPAPREDHTWTVDDSGRTAYLFGGRDGGTVYDDLWAFDLGDGSWREIEVAGARPAARFGHEAAWSPAKGGLLVSLGQAGATFYGDLWLFDPGTATWRELPARDEAPEPRYGSCSGIAPDGRFLISHGFTQEGVRFADTRAYDLEEERWIDVTPEENLPVERCLHACWWTVDGTFTLYGGQTTGVAALGDTWSYVPAADGGEPEWFRLVRPDAGPRQLVAVARRGLATYVFGGRDLDRRPLADAWVVDDRGAGAFQPLTTAGERPSPRSGAAMLHDEAADRLLLFGGIGDAALNDLWELTFD